MRRLLMILECSQLIVASKILKKSSPMAQARTPPSFLTTLNTQLSLSYRRIQCASARVTDPNVSADQLVQRWCSRIEDGPASYTLCRFPLLLRNAYPLVPLRRLLRLPHRLSQPCLWFASSE